MTLFWNLKVDNEPASQAALMQYQWNNYGLKLEILTQSSNDLGHAVQVENLEEIDRLMRKPPKSSRRVK